MINCMICGATLKDGGELDSHVARDHPGDEMVVTTLTSRPSSDMNF